MLNFNLKKLSLVFAGTAVVMMSANAASAAAPVTIQIDPNPVDTTNGLFSSIVGSQNIDFNNGTVPTSGFVTFSTQNGNNLDALGSVNGTTSGLLNGGINDIAAPPAVGNVSSTGQDTSDYLAVEPTDNVTLNFANQVSSFGLDWGSIDAGNTVSFYNGSTLVATVTGTNVANAAANGDQISLSNNPYVNFVAANGVTFNKAVLSTANPAFEIDNISYKAASVATPESSSLLGLLAVGVVGAASVLKSKKSAA
jgi:hypothetical protein